MVKCVAFLKQHIPFVAARGVAMNFIERMFGLSPDAGSGSFETMLLVLPLLCLAVIMLGRQRHLFHHKCD